MWYNTAQNLAIKEALKSHCNFKVGAVLSKKSNILSKGFNSKNTSPKGSGILKSKHAELVVTFRYLRLNGQTLPGAHVFVARVSKTGKLGLARPCHDCWSMLKSVGISTVFYTAPEGWREEKVL